MEEGVVVLASVLFVIPSVIALIVVIIVLVQC